MSRLPERGDTIVEVLLAMTLLSAILFTSWGIVSRSTQINTAARQRVVMVNQLKEQVEVIKALYNQPETRASVVGGTKTFGGAIPRVLSLPESIDANPCENTMDANRVINIVTPVNAFHFDNTASPQDGMRTVESYENARVWIQFAETGSYVDFYIRGCWLTPGGVNSEDNSHFVLRLNK